MLLSHVELTGTLISPSVPSNFIHISLTPLPLPSFAVPSNTYTVPSLSSVLGVLLIFTFGAVVSINTLIEREALFPALSVASIVNV